MKAVGRSEIHAHNEPKISARRIAKSHTFVQLLSKVAPKRLRRAFVSQLDDGVCGWREESIVRMSGRDKHKRRENNDAPRTHKVPASSTGMRRRARLAVVEEEALREVHADLLHRLVLLF